MRVILMSAVLVLQVLATNALSQEPQQGVQSRGRSYLGYGIPFAQYPQHTLLDREPVQKELKLSDRQKEKIKEIRLEMQKRGPALEQEYARKRQDAIQAGASREELSALSTGIVKDVAALIDGAILKVLDKNQRVRLAQIQVQVEGPMAFMRPEFQERLNLDEVTVEMIKGIVAEGREELVSVSGLPEEFATKLSSSRGLEERRALSKSKD